MTTPARALLAALLAPALTLDPRGCLRAFALALLVAAAGCADSCSAGDDDDAADDDDDAAMTDDDDAAETDDDDAFEVDAITFSATFTITPKTAGDDDDSAP